MQFSRFKCQGSQIVQSTELCFYFPNDDVPDVTLITLFSFIIFFFRAGERKVDRRQKGGILSALTKYYRQGGWKSRHLFLTIPEAGKVQSDLVLGEGSPPGLQTATVSLYARITSSLCAHREKKFWFFFLFLEDANTITSAPASWHHLNLSPPKGLTS